MKRINLHTYIAAYLCTPSKLTYIAAYLGTPSMPTYIAAYLGTSSMPNYIDFCKKVNVLR